MEINEAYKVMQKASGIEKGDVVKVLRHVTENEMGCSCVDSLLLYKKKAMLDKKFTVLTLRSNNIELDTDNGVFCFPFFALELIRKKEGMITIDGKEFSISTIKNALKQYVGE